MRMGSISDVLQVRNHVCYVGCGKSRYVITGRIAQSASRRYLIYSEADFEVFSRISPHRDDTLHQWG